jgi:hypothetical protein
VLYTVAELRVTEAAHLQDVGEEEEEPRVHPCAQADGRQNAQAHPPDDVTQPRLRLVYPRNLPPCVASCAASARSQASIHNHLHISYMIDSELAQDNEIVAPHGKLYQHPMVGMMSSCTQLVKLMNNRKIVHGKQ